jgi:DNA polymerase-3 subunit delta
MVVQVWKDIKKKKIEPVYCIYGNETYLIQETVSLLKKTIVDEATKDFNFSVYDLEEESIEHAVEDAETFPFMGNQRLVIAKSPSFLSSEKKKEKIDHPLDRFESYLRDPAPYTVFVLYAPYAKLDERKKITKLLKKEACMVEAKELSGSELTEFTLNLVAVEKKSISPEAAEQLILLTSGNLSAISQEVKKLCTYKINQEDITIDDVNKLVARNLEQNIFELINKIVNKQRTEALQIFYDLIKQKEEPIKMLALIINQFRLIQHVKYFQTQGYGQKQMASNIKIHPFRVKLALEQARLFSEEELKEIIKQLAEMDYEMKTGKRDKQLILELFLLNVLKDD